jgi:hypothetical protein
LLWLKDELDRNPFMELLDPVGLVTDDHNGFFGFDPVKRKVDGIVEHGDSKDGMEDLHEIRFHPGPFACCEDDRCDFLQCSTHLMKLPAASCGGNEIAPKPRLVIPLCSKPQSILAKANEINHLYYDGWF